MRNIVRDGHIHSPYCPHGTSDSFGQYITRALEIGLNEISFTEHLPLPVGFIDDEIREFCSPSTSTIAAYLEELEQVKQYYQQRIKINTGFEVDYLEGFEGFTKELLNKYGARTQDSILSIHFLKVKNQYYCLDATPAMFRELVELLGGVEQVYDAYYQTMLKSIRVDLGRYKPRRIGHPTLVRIFNSIFPFEYKNTALLKQIMLELKARGYEIDFNTAGLRKPYCQELYPSGIFFDLAKRYQIKMVLGSDAHTAQDVGRSFAAELLSGHDKVCDQAKKTPEEKV